MGSIDQRLNMGRIEEIEELLADFLERRDDSDRRMSRSERRKRAARKRRARRALFRKYRKACPAENKEFWAAIKELRTAQKLYRAYGKKKSAARRARNRSDYRRAMFGIAQARAQFHHANIRRKNAAAAFYKKIKAAKAAARKAYRSQRRAVIVARKRRNRALWQRARLELIKKGRAIKAARKTFYAAKRAFILKIRAARGKSCKR